MVRARRGLNEREERIMADAKAPFVGATQDQAVVEPLFVNKRELALALGVSEPTVDNWVSRRGMPVVEKGSNGVAWRFDLGACRAWKADQDAAEKRAADQLNGELFPEGQQLAPAGNPADVIKLLEAERLAQTINIQRRELIPRAEVENDYRAVFGVVRQALLGLEASIVRALNLDPTQADEVKRQVRGGMRNLAQAIADPALRPTEIETAIVDPAVVKSAEGARHAA
jgi:phage terminase Nu1 subunit (DNA packaging protein)